MLKKITGYDAETWCIFKKHVSITESKKRKIYLFQVTSSCFCPESLPCLEIIQSTKYSGTRMFHLTDTELTACKTYLGQVTIGI